MANRVIQSNKPSSEIITNNKEFGEHIKFARTSIEFKINDFANSVNINRNTIGKLENGSIGTRLSTAIEVANMLGLEIVVRKKNG